MTSLTRLLLYRHRQSYAVHSAAHPSTYIFGHESIRRLGIKPAITHGASAGIWRSSWSGRGRRQCTAGDSSLSTGLYVDDDATSMMHIGAGVEPTPGRAGRPTGISGVITEYRNRAAALTQSLAACRPHLNRDQSHHSSLRPLFGDRCIYTIEGRCKAVPCRFCGRCSLRNASFGRITGFRRR